MLISYYPEMKDAKPVAQIEATLSHYGKHWLLRTPLELKGRGIVHQGVMTARTLVPQAQHKAGWNRYKVTEAAFERICHEYQVSQELLL